MGFLDVIKGFFGDNSTNKPQSIDLDKLIDAALADGVVTDEEHAILLKKVKEVGMDVDEFELLLNGRIAEMNKNAAAEKLAPEQKPEAEKAMAEQLVAAEKAMAEQKAAAEKAMAEQKAAAEKAMAEQKAAAEKAMAEQKAAAEKAMAEQKAAAEKAMAEQKAAAEKTTSGNEVRLLINYVSSYNKICKKTIALPKKVSEEGNLKGYDSLKVTISSYKVKIQSVSGVCLMDKDIIGSGDSIKTVNSYEWTTDAAEKEKLENANEEGGFSKLIINYRSYEGRIAKKTVGVPKVVTAYGNLNGYDSIRTNLIGDWVRLYGKNGEVLMDKDIYGSNYNPITHVISFEWSK